MAHPPASGRFASAALRLESFHLALEIEVERPCERERRELRLVVTEFAIANLGTESIGHAFSSGLAGQLPPEMAVEAEPVDVLVPAR
jgi:hypothetical protein